MAKNIQVWELGKKKPKDKKKRAPKEQPKKTEEVEANG